MWVLAWFLHSSQGLDTTEGHIKLISGVIEDLLSMEVSVLMGANIAKDVAAEEFCEATIGKVYWDAGSHTTHGMESLTGISL